jgi:hypothetical protein
MGTAPPLAPLSRFLLPTDYEALGPELLAVDRRWDDTQHPARRWEYALALRALHQYAPLTTKLVAVDVGGAGSPFFRMVADFAGVYPEVVDPASGGPDLASYLAERPRLADVVTCLSVVEHVPSEADFFYHLACLTAPGGLLVLTMDAVGEEVEQDTYHYHWMRERIYTPKQLRLRVEALRRFQVEPEQPPDYAGFTPQVFDYSFASLVARKRA